MPLQSTPTSVEGIHADLRRASVADPVLPRGYAASVNETPYPFVPGAAARRCARAIPPRGSSERRCEPDVCHGAVHPTLPMRDALVRFGRMAGDGTTTWGPAVPVSHRSRPRRPRHCPKGRRGRAVDPGRAARFRPSGPSSRWPGSPTSSQARCRRLSFRPVAPGRRVPGLHGVRAPQATERIVGRDRCSGRRLPVTGGLEHDEVRSRSGCEAPVPVHGDPLCGLGLGVDRHGLGRTAAAPRASRSIDFELVQQVHVPAGNDVVTFHYRPPHLLLASVLSLGAIALLLGAARCLAGARAVAGTGVGCRPGPTAAVPQAAPGGDARTRGLTRRRRSAERVGQGREELARPRPPTSPRRRSRPRRAPARLVPV